MGAWNLAVLVRAAWGVANLLSAGLVERGTDGRYAVRMALGLCGLRKTFRLLKIFLGFGPDIA